MAPPSTPSSPCPHVVTCAVTLALTLAIGSAGEAFGETASTQPESADCPSELRTIALTSQEVVRTVSKAPRYTQGLTIHRDRLYEGAGMFGHSGVHMSALDGSTPTALTGLDDGLFGEGLAIVGRQAYQLTWQAQRAYVYDLRFDGTLKPSQAPTRPYEGEGWGLAAYGEQLLLSDGTATLRVLDPADFAVVREISVRAGARPVRGLNELEVVGDQLLANLYGPPVIAVIDIGTGCVHAALDAAPIARAVQPLLPKGEDAICGSFGCTASDYVLNGIAYDGERDELYLTGKNWPRVYVLDNPL